MTQVEKTGFRWSRLILGVAVVALGFAVAQAVKNRGAADEPAAPGASATAAADPLATLEARTRERPDDASAWAALGGGLFDAGRFAESAAAYEKATSLAPGTAAFWSSLGEARVMASSSDPMPDQARAAFEKALAQDPKDPRARYFMAVARDLSGDHKGAIDDWLALLADTPPGAPWEADLRRTIEQVARINKVDVSGRLAATSQPEPQLPLAARGIPGPSAEDLRAASAMPPSEQRQMAQGMVSRLEARLKDNPANVDGWIMLIRSRVTLGEPDKAKQALADAVAANPASAGMIREQAGLLGVK